MLGLADKEYGDTVINAQLPQEFARVPGLVPPFPGFVASNKSLVAGADAEPSPNSRAEAATHAARVGGADQAGLDARLGQMQGKAPYNVKDTVIVLSESDAASPYRSVDLTLKATQMFKQRPQLGQLKEESDDDDSVVQDREYEEDREGANGPQASGGQTAQDPRRSLANFATAFQEREAALTTKPTGRAANPNFKS